MTLSRWRSGAQTVFLPIVGLVETDELKPADLVGSNKDTYLILDKLPPECVAEVLGRTSAHGTVVTVLPALLRQV